MIQNQEEKNWMKKIVMQILELLNRDFKITISDVFKKINEMIENFTKELEYVKEIVKWKS